MPRLVVDLNDARPVWTVPAATLEAIRSAVPAGWEVCVLESVADGRGDGGASSPDALRAVRGAEVYLGYGFPRALFDAAHADGAAALRWVHSAAAGVGGSLYPEMRRSPIVLTNAAGVHAAPMAETVVAAILHFARGFDFAVAAQRGSRWDRAPFDAADTPVGEVAGATVGIVGFGGIGRAVAERARALGMRVLALKRTPGGAEPGVELVAGEQGLATLLERSDYLVLSLPGTETTRGMIGAAELERLRRGAVLVSVGRGNVLDEDALAERLRAGHLRGAALDVFQHEPLPPESPLWTLPNVLITPHVSATSRGFWARQTELIRDNLRRYLAGEPLRNVVDKQAGY